MPSTDSGLQTGSKRVRGLYGDPSLSWALPATSLSKSSVFPPVVQRRRGAILQPMMPSSPTGHDHPWGEAATPFEELGGEEAVRELSETFYDVIEEASPLLREMLPANTKNTRQKFFMYLCGWLGGPPLYEEKYGHPRLRMRHFPFPIDDAAAAEWMRCMGMAMDRAQIDEPLRTFLESRLAPLADHMKNR